nr:hypothetical protein [Mesorhizobium sp.]
MAKAPVLITAQCWGPSFCSLMTGAPDSTLIFMTGRPAMSRIVQSRSRSRPWGATKILTAQMQDVESAEGELFGIPHHAGVHLVEVRPAVGIGRDHLNIEDKGLGRQLLGRSDDRPIPFRPVVAIAGERQMVRGREGRGPPLLAI